MLIACPMHLFSSEIGASGVGRVIVGVIVQVCVLVIVPVTDTVAVIEPELEELQLLDAVVETVPVDENVEVAVLDIVLVTVDDLVDDIV